MNQEFALQCNTGGGGGTSVVSLNFSAGTTSNNLTNLVFSNSNNVSFGLNGSTVTATATVASTQGSVNLSAGTTSNLGSAFVFSNANNVSFGLDGSTVTGSIATTYAGTGFTTATTAGTAIVGTLNTSGLSMGVPAFLTTAMQSNASTISNINISAGTTSTNASAFTFNNANGVSFGLGTGASAGSVTASIATTYAGTGFTTATTAGTAIVGTLNTSGLSMGVPAFLTTAMASNAATISNINISAGTTSTNASAFTFNNANGVSFGMGTGASAGSITGSIATTYAGTGVTTATTTGTNIVATLNTSGLSMGVPAFLTAASAAGTFGVSANNTSYALSSLNFLDSVGGVTFTLGIGANSSCIIGSIATPSVNFSAGTTSNNLASVVFSNSNGVSFGLNGSTITGGLNILSFYENLPIQQGTQGNDLPAGGGSTLYFQPFIVPHPVSFGFMRIFRSGSGVSTTFGGTSANTSFSCNRSNSLGVVIYSQGTGASSESLMSMFSTQMTYVFQTAFTNGTAGSQYTVSFKITYATETATASYSTSYAVSSGTYNVSSESLSLFTGQQYHDIPWATSLDAGNYWMALGISTNLGSNVGGPANLTGAALFHSQLFVSNVNISWGIPGFAQNTTNLAKPGLGIFTTNSRLYTTAGVPYSQIGRSASHPQLLFQLIRKA